MFTSSSMHGYATTIIVGLMTNDFSYKIANALFKNIEKKKKINKAIMFLFATSIFGMLTIDKIKYYNNMHNKQKIIDGLKLGSIFLFITTFINYWSHMTEDTKLIGISITLLWLLYKSSPSNSSRKSDEPI